MVGLLRLASKRFQVRVRPNTRTQLLNQGSTLVLELGPHKDRENSAQGGI